MRYIHSFETDPYMIERFRQEHRKHNQVMIWVLQACSEFGIECLEVWASSLTCVYRFPGEKEHEAHSFLYSTRGAEYEHVRSAVHDAILEKYPAFDPILWTGED